MSETQITIIGKTYIKIYNKNGNSLRIIRLFINKL